MNAKEFSPPSVMLPPKGLSSGPNLNHGYMAYISLKSTLPKIQEKVYITITN
jgi:hypothetical protein